MQGYIINFNRVKDEDLIVTILTKNSVQTLYRFYGARHSHINLGYKIDFESQSSIKSNIAQLRGVLHLASQWNLDRDRMFIWQSFIKLFFLHLKDVEDIDDFYFNLLEEANTIWHVQNPKRIAIEKYTKLLAYEGRLHDEFVCFNCEKQIEDKPSLARSFLPAHETCIWREPFELLGIKELFSKKSSIFIDDATIERLWKIVLEGF